MTCPPDYICQATPTWLVVVMVAALLVFLAVICVVDAWGKRR